jgi:hypothetical protein
MEFLSGFGGFFFPFGFLLLGVVVLATIAIVGRRTTPDPTGRRPMASYLLAVMFVTLLVAAGAVAQMGRAVAREVVNEDAIWAVTVGESFVNYTPVMPETRRFEFIGLGANQIWSELLEAGLVGLLAAVIFEFHRRRWRELLRKESGDG